MSSFSGYELPFLLAGAFRGLIDDLHVELSKAGHANARPVHGFALQAIGPTGLTISDLGRQLGISKQAASKTAKSLEACGYATRRADPDDARAIRIFRTAEAESLLELSMQFFERRKAEWIAVIGQERFEELFKDLERFAQGRKTGDLPGWLL